MIRMPSPGEGITLTGKDGDEVEVTIVSDGGIYRVLGVEAKDPIIGTALKGLIALNADGGFYWIRPLAAEGWDG